MKLEIIVGHRIYDKELDKKVHLIINDLVLLLTEVEFFKYIEENHDISAGNSLHSIIPEDEYGIFIESIKQATDAEISMFRYKNSIVMRFRLIRISRGYSTVVSRLGEYMWTINTNGSIVFENIK